MTAKTKVKIKISDKVFVAKGETGKVTAFQWGAEGFFVLMNFPSSVAVKCPAESIELI